MSWVQSKFNNKKISWRISNHVLHSLWAYQIDYCKIFTNGICSPHSRFLSYFRMFFPPIPSPNFPNNSISIAIGTPRPSSLHLPLPSLIHYSHSHLFNQKLLRSSYFKCKEIMILLMLVLLLYSIPSISLEQETNNI